MGNLVVGKGRTPDRIGLYYEFYKNGEFVSKHMETVGNITINCAIDTVPTLSMTIPLANLPEENLALYDVWVHISSKTYERTMWTGGNNAEEDDQSRYVFHGVVDEMNINYARYTVDLNLSHYVARMRDWLMPVNYTVKNYTLSDLIGPKGAALGHPDTLGDPQAYDSPKILVEAAMVNHVQYSPEDDVKVSMTFSANNKLEALSEIINNTESQHFRVPLFKSNGIDTKVQIGPFGFEQPCVISPIVDPDEEENLSTKDTSYNDWVTGMHYVTMLTEPNYNVDYTDHFNRAVVFCGDIGEGVMHLTLKDMYDRKDMWEDGFPIGMYDKEINLQPETEYEETSSGKYKKINNEKIYKDNEIISFANNDNREYYVEDHYQKIKDGGVIRHDVYNFSDMYPIPKTTGTDDDGNEIEYVITDDDRLEMVNQAYHRAIRKLKAQRPQNIYQFNCEALPRLIMEGDKVHFKYVKKVTIPAEDGSGDYSRTAEKTIVNIDKWLYVTKRTITFDEALNEVCTLTLDEELRTKDISPTEVELHELAGGDGTGIQPKWDSDQGEVGDNDIDNIRHIYE